MVARGRVLGCGGGMVARGQGEATGGGVVMLVGAILWGRDAVWRGYCGDGARRDGTF